MMALRAWRRGEERLTPLLAGVLLLVVACNAKRERAEERVMAADSTWHLQAWGITRLRCTPDSIQPQTWDGEY